MNTLEPLSAVSSAPGIATGVGSFIRSLSRGNVLTGFMTALFLGSGYLYIQGGSAASTTTSASVAMVEYRTIVTSIKAVGTVTFASEQQMTFNQKGTVAVVNVREGDSVKKGQVIAELDKTSVLSDIRQAELAIGASSLQLKQLQNDSRQTTVDAENAKRESERQLKQAQADLAISKAQLPSTLEAAKRSVEEKKKALEQAKLDLEKQRVAELQSLAMTAQEILTGSEKLLDSLYSTLTRGGVRPLLNTAVSVNVTIDPLLYKDQTLANKVQFAYLDAVNAVEAIHAKYGASLATERDPSTLIDALTDSESLAQNISILAERTYQMMMGATTDPNTFTTTDLNASRTTVSANRSTATDLISQAETAKANLAAAASDTGIPSITLKAKQDAVTTADHALTLAEDNLAILSQQNPASLEQQEAAVAKLEEDLQSKTANVGMTSVGTDVSIRLKQNTIAQQAASLQKTKKLLDDYRLVAPFDGVIRHLDYQVGDNLSDTNTNSTQKFVSIENMDFIIVTIPLDQVDVVRVKPGMTATIAFDAVPGQSFQGLIDVIDPTAVTTSGVVSYNVKVKLPSPAGLTILSGMTATVTIETARKDNVLAVPNLAIRSENGQSTLQTPTGTPVGITTGITDGRYTEVVSGVREGDAIISINLTTSTTSKSNTQNNSQQLLRGVGGGGPPGR